MIKTSSLRLALIAAALAVPGVPLVVTAALGAQDVRSLGTESGFGIFQQRCMSCHGNPEYSEKVPSPSALRELSPEAIYESLTSGAMNVEGEKMSDEERRRVAESVSGRLLGTGTNGDAAAMPNRCSFETARDFPTTNNVAARGGSIRAPGVTVAGGMVFVASGYGVFPNDRPGNVLLAFSPR